jgi:beta-fructofuranosidase
MAVGSRINEVGGAVFLYRSHNLIHWEYLNPLLTGTIQKNGTIWECPNFFPLGDQWVLIISSHLGNTTGSVLYFVGRYEDYRFTPSYEGVLDYGHLYAPLTTVDAQGRRLLMGWLREARTPVEQQTAGWSGAQSIPRVLSLDAQGRLTMPPIPELERIRGRHHHFAAADLAGDGATGVSGLALDIAAAFDPAKAASCGLSLICEPDGKERVEIVYENARLVVRKVSADVGDSVNTHVREVPHALAAGEPLRLRVLLDGSVIEAIANDRTSVTSRFYPMGQTSVTVHARGGDACTALDIWEMPSIWE